MTLNIKPTPSRNLAGKEPQPTPKGFAQNQNHQVKTFANLAGEPTQPKSGGLQNDLPKDSLNSK